MAHKQSVVTPERFASGFTYRDYLSQLKVNRDKYEQYYKTEELSNDDVAFFRQIHQGGKGVAKILVLAEDWCPDAFRGVPVVVRIAEAAGMELRIFLRDKNLDMMKEFLNQGKFQSIPTFVFYTKDTRYIAHWIERPALANEERRRIEAEFKQKKPKATEEEIRQALRPTQARYPAWQKETIREIRELLAQKLGLKS